MNYIQEELLRQRKALAALMSGAPAQEAEEQERSGLERAELKTGETAAADRAAAGDRGRAGEAGAEELSASGKAAGRQVGDLRSGASQRSGGWTALQRTGPWQTGSGAAAADRTETDLRAVSRGVQRDARRYDGGFSTY